MGILDLKNELSKKIDVYPNNYMTRKNFIYKIVADMLTHGNSVVYPSIQDGLLDNLTIWDINRINFQGDLKKLIQSNINFKSLTQWNYYILF